jgi:hypothetical protein
MLLISADVFPGPNVGDSMRGPSPATADSVGWLIGPRAFGIIVSIMLEGGPDEAGLARDTVSAAVMRGRGRPRAHALEHPNRSCLWAFRISGPSQLD